jgi:hypothetical protein
MDIPEYYHLSIDRSFQKRLDLCFFKAEHATALGFKALVVLGFSMS